jgi:hypothetical protein
MADVVANHLTRRDMSLRSKIRSGVEVAVFTRIDRRHLEDACKLCKDDPKKAITFRSRIAWASAEDALGVRTPRAIYIAPIDGNGVVEYEADLFDVEPNAKRGNLRTEKLFGFVLEHLKKEEWTDPCTLYVIRNCRQLPHSFHMTELLKLSDGKPISIDYARAYSVVYPHNRR